MYPIIFSCSYFTLYSFGMCLFIGFSLYSFLLEQDPVLRPYLLKISLSKLLLQALITGLCISRIVFVLSEWKTIDSAIDLVMLSNGGLSILGALLGICGYIAYACRRYKLPFKTIADRAALYAPLGQVVGRIGCFFAGCCHGIPTTVPWALVYTHPLSMATRGIGVHPTQLYSLCLLLLIFCFLWVLQKKYSRLKKGSLALIYLVCVSSERCLIDFLRADRIMLKLSTWLSFHQLLALCLGITGILACIYNQFFTRSSDKNNTHE
jgi:phosphatidylglycerol:prolipoprotein diacylglycerol transferase